jgi:hypothetical protein
LCRFNGFGTIGCGNCIMLHNYMPDSSSAQTASLSAGRPVAKACPTAASLDLTLCQHAGQAVDARSNLLEALWAVVHRIHGGDVGQQGLGGADVGGGLVAPDVLLTRLKAWWWGWGGATGEGKVRWGNSRAATMQQGRVGHNAATHIQDGRRCQRRTVKTSCCCQLPLHLSIIKNTNHHPGPGTCMAMRSAGCPCASRDTPIMRPGSSRLNSSWHARNAAWGPP